MDDSDDIREKLVQRGFSIARKPFLEDRYWARDQERQEYSIDMAKRRYCRWRQPELWRPLDELLQDFRERAETVEAVISVRENVGFFVAECLAAGLVWDEELNSGPTHTVAFHTKPVDLGNRWLRWRDRVYLACEWSKKLVELGSRPLTDYTLAELTGRSVIQSRQFGFDRELPPPQDSAALRPRDLFGD